MEPASLLEEIRFGYGPRAGTTPSPGGLEPDRLLAQLTATDPDAAKWDRPPLSDRYDLWAQYIAGKKAFKATKPGNVKPPTGEAGTALKEMDALAGILEGEVREMENDR